MNLYDLIHEHMTVWDALGERVGVVSAIGEHRFFISHGPAIHELEANREQILEVRDDECFLNVRRSELFRARPPGEEGYEKNEQPFHNPAFDQHETP